MVESRFPFAEPQPPNYLTSINIHREALTPPVWFREQPTDWRTNLNFRESRARLIPWTRIAADDTPGSISLRAKVWNLFIPGRRTRRRLWYRRRELQLQMLDAVRNRPAVLEDMRANSERQQPRPWGNPPIFAPLDTPFTPFRNCGDKPQKYRTERGIPIWCPRAMNTTTQPPPPPIKTRKRKGRPTRNQEKAAAQLLGCSAWESDTWGRPDPTRACRNQPLFFRCRRHGWTYTCKRHRYCLQCFSILTIRRLLRLTWNRSCRWMVYGGTRVFAIFMRTNGTGRICSM